MTAGLTSLFTPHLPHIYPYNLDQLFYTIIQISLSPTAGVTNSTPHQSPVTPGLCIKLSVKIKSQNKNQKIFFFHRFPFGQSPTVINSSLSINQSSERGKNEIERKGKKFEIRNLGRERVIYLEKKMVFLVQFDDLKIEK